MWDNVKRNVRRQYTTTTTLADVKSRLNADFSTLDTNMVSGCIKKANNVFAELLDRIMVMEVIEEDEETIENADSESDNDNLGGK